MFKEFKEFVMRGNVVDLAVGIIIGGAFGKIVTSLVGDVLMPPLGRLMGNMDFSGLFINLSGTSYPSLAAAKAAGAATINYGLFINTVIDFIIVAAAIFVLIKQVNRLKKPVVAAAPATKACPYCLSNVPLKATRCFACTSELKAAWNFEKATESTSKLAPGQRVNINSASKEEFETIPGIGPAKSQTIIDGRPYNKIEDIMKVKGIKEGTFNKIKDYITVR